MFTLYNIAFILALRAWIRHEDLVLRAGRLNLVDIERGDPRMARALNALAAAYRELAIIVGIDPHPALLLRLGPIGVFIHAVTCQVGGTWQSFGRAVARRHSDLPSSTPLTADERKLESRNELIVLRGTRKLSGISKTAIHPQLGATAYRADLGLTAVTDRSLFIEVTMLTDDPTSDNRCQREYRLRLETKLAAYRKLGLELPVVLGYDDLSPRRLEIKMCEILYRLGLPVPPLRSSGWFEGDYDQSCQAQLLALLRMEMK